MVQTEEEVEGSGGEACDEVGGRRASAAHLTIGAGILRKGAVGDVDVAVGANTPASRFRDAAENLGNVLLRLPDWDGLRLAHHEEG